MRVDLFFEMTSQLTSEQYRYNTVLVPCQVTYKSQVMFRPVPHLTCDWRATLTQHLSQGWRLVDIYIDIPTVSQVIRGRMKTMIMMTMTMTVMMMMMAMTTMMIVVKQIMLIVTMALVVGLMMIMVVAGVVMVEVTGGPPSLNIYIDIPTVSQVMRKMMIVMMTMR